MSLLWRLAFRNLLRQRKRNAATGLAVAAGFMGLLLFGGYIYRTEHYLRVNAIYINNAGHIGIFKNGGLDNFFAQPERYLISHDETARMKTLLGRTPEVEFVGENLKGMGLISNACQSFPFLGVGMELETDRKIRHHPEVLRWTPELAYLDHGQAISEFSDGKLQPVTVTPGLARKLGKTAIGKPTAPAAAAGAAPLPMPDCKNPLELEKLSKESGVQLIGRNFAGDMSALDADLVGIYSTGLALSEDTGLTSSLGQMRSLLGTDGNSSLSVFLKQGASVSGVLKRLRAQPESEGLELHAYSEEKLSLFYVGVMNFLYTMGSFFFFLVLGVITVSVVNFVAVGIFERSSELGMMRALGFNLEQIARAFMYEIVLLNVVALTAGAVAATAFSNLINSMNIRFRPPGIAGDMQFVLMPVWWLILAFGLLLLGLSIATALISAKQRARAGIPDLLEAKQ